MTTQAQPGLIGSPAIETEERALLRFPASAASSRRLGLTRELAVLSGVLAVGLAVRMIQISQPFVDQWSWRQADVAMIARNFSRHGFNIFSPQIDWAGSSPGYVGTEFPMVPFLASLLYPFVGEHEWIGRSISIFFFAVSVPFLYLLVRKTSNERSALFAAVGYTLAPLGIFASRAFMPDMASLSLSIAALYLFAEWLDRKGDARFFAASCAAASLAILVKLPAVIIGLPLAYLAARAHGVGFVRRPALWVWATVTLGLPLAWYLHAYAMSLAYEPHHMFGEGGLRIVDLESYAGIVRNVVSWELTPVVAAGMVGGFVLPSRSRVGGVFHWWLIAMILFTFLAGRGSSWHAWYQLPLVPVAAALAGRACDAGLSWMNRHGGPRAAAALGCLCIAGASALAVAEVRPLYEPLAGPLRDAGVELNRITPVNSLVVFTEWDPTTVYYSGRKGWRLERGGISWAVPRNTEEAIDALDMLRARGAEYLVFTSSSRSWFERYPGFQQYLDSRYQRTETDEYTIFDLRSPEQGTGHAGQQAEVPR